MLSKRFREFAVFLTELCYKLKVLPIPLKLNLKKGVIEAYHTEVEKINTGFILASSHAFIYVLYHIFRFTQLLRRSSEKGSHHTLTNDSFQSYVDLTSSLSYLIAYSTISFITLQLYNQREEILRFLVLMLRLDNALKGK